MSQAPDNSNGEQTANEPASRTESASDSSPGVRSLDAIFEVLVAERRRNALYVLYRHSDPITLSDLADEVAALEGEPAERVAAGLHHVHVPKLVEEGIADYDAEEGSIRLTDPSDLFREYLQSAAEDERRPLRRAAESATLSEF